MNGNRIGRERLLCREVGYPDPCINELSYTVDEGDDEGEAGPWTVREPAKAENHHLIPLENQLYRGAEDQSPDPIAPMIQ